MVRSTIITRASDALPLAASVDDEEVSVYMHPTILSILRYSRQRQRCKSTSNKPSSFSAAYLQTPSLDAPLRVGNIPSSQFPLPL